MIFGPVLPVELVTSSRRVRYFIVRVVYAAILLITLWTQYESSMTWRVNSGAPVTASVLSEFANEFFQSFSVVQLLAVLVLTPALVAGAIAEEKERKTIEYLFVTDLRNSEIVLGKLVARMLHLVVLIAVGWPVLALLMLLGGIAMENVLAGFAITGSTALAVAALSIWSSVQARRGRDAVMRVFVIGLALLILPPIADGFSWFAWAGWGAVQAVVDELMAANPFVCLMRAMSQSGTKWDAVLELMRDHAVLTVPCAAFAVLRVRRVYLQQAHGTPAKRGRLSLRVWRPELGDSPMLWKELFAERPVFTLGVIGLIAQALLFLGVLIPALVIFVNRMNTTNRGMIDELEIYVIGVGTTVACVGLLAVAVRAASSVTAERERQTWDVLMSTPIDPWEVVRGKVAGSLYAMRGIVLLLVILWILGMLGGAVYPLMVPVVAGELAIFGGFAAVVGLLFSLKMKTSLRAMAATVGTTVFVGGAYLFCCMPLLWSGPNDAEFVLAGCVPFLLGVPVAFNPKTFFPTNDNDVRMATTYVIGIGLYLMVTLFLFVIARANFDDLTGRICRHPYRVDGLPRTIDPTPLNGATGLARSTNVLAASSPQPISIEPKPSVDE
jgi:ABC-type transport system involved in multi-copper enzyme maturation permease subunit